MKTQTLSNKKKLTVHQAGKLGGLATKKTHGREHYRKIGSIGGKKPKKRV